MIIITDKTKCAGCWACYNICPQHCISMETDEEGFKYPRVDKNKCVNCGLCNKVCPVLKREANKEEEDKRPACYACFSTNEDEQLKSSSGGVFSLLAKHVLKENGIVYGVASKDAYTAEHVRIENDISPLRTSKYIQSEIKNAFSLVKEDLKQGKLVLFTGTTCQIEGLKSYLNIDYPNLITQDIICHGVPSPKVWELYLKENSFSREASVNFRDKYFGWDNYSIKVQENNKCFSEKFSKNDFMTAFLSDVIVRPSCYSCQFKTTTRCSDITLADFWGVKKVYPEIYNPNGTSLVLINSQKGFDLFNNIKSELKFEEVNFEKAISNNKSYLHSAKRPKSRAKFFKNLNKKPIKALVKKYCQPNFFVRAIRKGKWIVKGILKSISNS